MPETQTAPEVETPTVVLLSYALVKIEKTVDSLHLGMAEFVDDSEHEELDEFAEDVSEKLKAVMFKTVATTPVQLAIVTLDIPGMDRAHFVVPDSATQTNRLAAYLERVLKAHNIQSDFTVRGLDDLRRAFPTVTITVVYKVPFIYSVE